MVILNKIFQRRVTELFTVLIVSFLSSASVFANSNEKIASFSAETVQLNPQGSVVSTGKVATSEYGIRVDGIPSLGLLSGMKLNHSLLILKKHNKQFLFNHSNKRVFITTQDKNKFLGNYKRIGNIKVLRTLGIEQVAGYACRIKELSVKYNIAGQVFTSAITVWENSQFDIPLRVKGENGYIQEIRNINFDTPDKSLFQPLAQYQTAESLLDVLDINISSLVNSIDLDDLNKTFQKMLNNFNQP